MKIFSAIILLIVVQITSALNLRGEAGATSRDLPKSVKRQLQGGKVGGMGMMVRLLLLISLQESYQNYQ